MGFDFADALKAVSSVNCTAVVTFDRKFENLANKIKTIAIQEIETGDVCLFNTRNVYKEIRQQF